MKLLINAYDSVAIVNLLDSVKFQSMIKKTQAVWEHHSESIKSKYFNRKFCLKYKKDDKNLAQGNFIFEHELKLLHIISKVLKNFLFIGMNVFILFFSQSYYIILLKLIWNVWPEIQLIVLLTHRVFGAFLQKLAICGLKKAKFVVKWYKQLRERKNWWNGMFVFICIKKLLLFTCIR